MTATDETLSNEVLISLNKTGIVREQLADMLSSFMDPNHQKKFDGGVLISSLFPRFIRVQGKEKAEAAWQLLGGEQGDRTEFSNATFTLKKDNFSASWWELSEVVNSNDQMYYPYPVTNKSEPFDFLTIIALNDKVAPQELSWFAGYGIIGLYVSLVLVIGRFVRLIISGMSNRIMFEELPSVDRILKLCLDIFMVRESGELILEEELFAKLIFLYRSPSTMIKWTKLKQR